MPRRRRRRLATGPDRDQRAAVHIAGRAIVSALLLGRAAVRRAWSRPGTWVELASDGRAVEDLELEELQARATALLAGVAAEDRVWGDGATLYASVAEVVAALALVDAWLARTGWGLEEGDATALRAVTGEGRAQRLAIARGAQLELLATAATEAVARDMAAIRTAALVLLDWGSLDARDLGEALGQRSSPETRPGRDAL